MKLLLPFLLSFFPISLFGQTTTQTDSLNFCFTKYKVPEGCNAEVEYQVSCDNYSMIWLYMNEKMLATTSGMYVDQLTTQVKVLKKDTITCYLLNEKVKGYRISFKKGTGTDYQLIVYGIANHQPVLVQLILDKEPKKNEDIPEFPRQIIRLTK